MGVLFDFTGNDHNTTVQKVEDMVKEQSVRSIKTLKILILMFYFLQFAEAIKEEPDLFLLAGLVPSLESASCWQSSRHMPVSKDNCKHFDEPTYEAEWLESQTGPLVHNAIWAVHAHTPIIILGGKLFP